MKNPPSSDPFLTYMNEVEQYLQRQEFDEIAELANQSFTVTPLAKGEYNLNYLLQSKDLERKGNKQFVFRVNIGTQIEREDQIIYEFNTLKLLQNSRVTPRPYFVDDSRTLIDKGISIMEYLPGNHLEYEHDLKSAAQVLSKIHQLPVQQTSNHLIVEKEPLSLIFTESKKLLSTYFQ